MTEKAPDIEKDLFGDRFKPDDAEHRKVLLEEYKLFVDTMEKAVARRQTVNSFYFSANTVLLGTVGVIMKMAFQKIEALAVMFPLAVVGIML
jgi:hypothetical protein